jgi:hypothetical protein
MLKGAFDDICAAKIGATTCLQQFFMLVLPAFQIAGKSMHLWSRLLCRLASEFDRLAVTREWPLGFRDEDGGYFRERAAREVTAAVNAGHPGARLAHLQIAQRYEELSQAIQRRAVERRQA